MKENDVIILGGIGIFFTIFGLLPQACPFAWDGPGPIVVPECYPNTPLTFFGVGTVVVSAILFIKNRTSKPNIRKKRR